MIKLKDLRDIAGARVSLIVEDPVPTLRGPTSVDEDDDVSIEIDFGSGVVLAAVVTAGHYMRIRKAVEDRQRAEVAML